jgi:hypothetical protein
MFSQKEVIRMPPRGVPDLIRDETGVAVSRLVET